MATATEAVPRGRDFAALGAAFVTVVFWASAFVGIRSAGRSFAPGPLSLGRLAVASVVLLAVCAARGERLPSFLGVVVIAIATAGHAATTTGLVLCLASAAAYAGGAVTQLRSAS
jgi:hypothetical protein